MTEIVVQPDVLEGLATRLGAVAQRLKGEKGSRGNYTANLGSDHLADAVGDFIKEWSDGVDKICGHVEEAQSILGGAGTTYRTFDSDLAASLGGDQ